MRTGEIEDYFAFSLRAIKGLPSEQDRAALAHIMHAVDDFRKSRMYGRRIKQEDITATTIHGVSAAALCLLACVSVSAG